MKKYFYFILSILITLTFISCDTDLGTPPELFLSFTIDGFDDSGSTLLVDYTLTNDSDEDLENCKIRLLCDTTTGFLRYWTDGVDLDKGETYSIDNKNTNYVGDLTNNNINDIKVIAAGFDRADSRGVMQSSVIEYYSE